MIFFVNNEHKRSFLFLLIFFIAFQSQSPFSYSSPAPLGSFQKSLDILKDQLKQKGKKNIVIAPQLIALSNLAADKMKCILRNETPFPIPYVGTSIKGFHLVSKSVNIDEHLPKFNLPYTSSSQLAQQTTTLFAEELNSKITRETHGMIQDFVEEDLLNSPTIKYIIYSWLYQKVAWEKPFSPYKKTLSWNGEENSQIRWMEKETAMGYITRSNLGLISIPVKEDGIKAVVIFNKERHIHLSQTEDILWLLENFTGLEQKFRLVIPQCNFTYSFFDNSLDQHSKHSAALKINHQGVEVGAASYHSSYRGFRRAPPEEVIINHSFIFGLVKDDSLIAAAYIHQPWVN
ncbi:serpin family protein [Candidatus Sororendozoicomonas aggregata]|uniref:serpin family protein n=1 Tax=Candidatus Sororendozoicomonas aggregata TaxID=3073239 RepID=UPI002ED014C6